MLAVTGGAIANDSIGHLSAGGIVLGRSNDIEMRSEDLYVSTKEIRVRYRFFNTSDKDITTLVAFPMPDLPAPSDGDNLAVPVDSSPNFMDFKTQVGGKPVDMQVEQRALALGIDRTDLLKSLNVPLAPFDAATKAVQALAPEKQTELVGFGVLRVDTYDIGQGMKDYMHPNWTLRTTYYWNQVFPAKTELGIEHQYQPSVGASVETMVGNPQGDATERETYRKRYCMDRDFIAAAQKTSRRAQGQAAHGEAPRICADHRRSLGRTDQGFPPRDRQGRGAQPHQRLRQVQEDLGHSVRNAAGRLLPRAQSRSPGAGAARIAPPHATNRRGPCTGIGQSHARAFC